MTREEELQKAAESFCSNTNPLLLVGDYSFIQGAKWADANPKSPWINVDEDLPCNHEELIHFGFTNNVLVIDDQQNTFIAFMKKYKDEWIWDSTNNFVFLPLITHWMPLPELPKE